MVPGSSPSILSTSETKHREDRAVQAGRLPARQVNVYWAHAHVHALLQATSCCLRSVWRAAEHSHASCLAAHFFQPALWAASLKEICSRRPSSLDCDVAKIRASRASQDSRACKPDPQQGRQTMPAPAARTAHAISDIPRFSATGENRWTIAVTGCKLNIERNCISRTCYTNWVHSTIIFTELIMNLLLYLMYI